MLELASLYGYLAEYYKYEECIWWGILIIECLIWCKWDDFMLILTHLHFLTCNYSNLFFLHMIDWLDYGGISNQILHLINLQYNPPGVLLK